MRLFLAIQPDERALDELVRLQSFLGDEVRLTPREQIHLTLKFMGEVPEEKVPEIQRTVSSCAGRYPSFHLPLKGIGGFPNLKRPRVIWAGLDSEATVLKSLVLDIEAELEDFGIPAEDRDFSPHITIARAGRNERKTIRVGVVPPEENLNAIFEVKELLLFESVLTGKGAIHTVLSRHQLIA